MMRDYKCSQCFSIVENDKSECPLCGEKILIKEMCIKDTGACKCAHDTHENVTLCPICKEPVCPECFSHDVVGISRVTGYLSDVAGWRASKKAELKDRCRVNIE